MINDFDPRLKILLALIIPYCSFKLISIIGLSLNYFLIIILFLSIGEYKSATKICKYAFILFILNYLSLKYISYLAILRFFSIAFIFIIKFSPIGIMIYFVSSKMKSGHFIASMQSIHLPKSMIIIFAVILRFLPTLKIELESIKNAMKLRGITLNFKNLITKPIKTIEFAGVPLIMRSMTLSDGLSAAAMCRGLDLERKNTSYISLRLSLFQVLLTIFIIGLCFINLYFDSALYISWSIL